MSGGGARGAHFRRVPLHQRFFKYVDQSAGPDQCHPWIGATVTSRGGAKRGKIRADWQPGDGTGGKFLIAARVALALATDGEIPGPEIEIAHSCDNPICVNWRHLEWKTHVENMADYIAKYGRIGARKIINDQAFAEAVA